MTAEATAKCGNIESKDEIINELVKQKKDVFDEL